MRLIRLAFVTLALALGFAAQNASAATTPTPTDESIQQLLTFSINVNYETTTNSSENDTLTNYSAIRHSILVSTHNVIKAITLDLFGREWTNWDTANIVRRVNPTNGAEGIYLRQGSTFIDISSFFGTSYLDDFTHDVFTACPGLTNNFTPALPVFFGSFKDDGGVLTSNTISLANIRYISLNTTNLKFNLLGVNLSALSSGRVTNVVSRVGDSLYTNQIDTILVNAVGSFYINIGTNIFTSPFQPHTGPARGTWTTLTPYVTPFPGPPGPPGPPGL